MSIPTPREVEGPVYVPLRLRNWDKLSTPEFIKTARATAFPDVWGPHEIKTKEIKTLKQMLLLELADDDKKCIQDALAVKEEELDLIICDIRKKGEEWLKFLETDPAADAAPANQ